MKKWLLLLCFSFSSILYADSPLILKVEKKSPKFVISLPANPTTGYHWEITKFDKSLLKLTHSEYIRPKTNLMGAPGFSLFTFSKQPHKSYPTKTKLVFTYTKSWDKSQDTVKPVTVLFVH
jgi:inhibitor of cysteine peptidase